MTGLAAREHADRERLPGRARPGGVARAARARVAWARGAPTRRTSPVPGAGVAASRRWSGPAREATGRAGGRDARVDLPRPMLPTGHHGHGVRWPGRARESYARVPPVRRPLRGEEPWSARVVRIAEAPRRASAGSGRSSSRSRTGQFRAVPVLVAPAAVGPAPQGGQPRQARVVGRGTRPPRRAPGGHEEPTRQVARGGQGTPIGQDGGDVDQRLPAGKSCRHPQQDKRRPRFGLRGPTRAGLPRRPHRRPLAGAGQRSCPMRWCPRWPARSPAPLRRRRCSSG